MVAILERGVFPWTVVGGEAMNFDEWYRANIGEPGKYPENTEHFRHAFLAGMAHQRELDSAAKMETKKFQEAVKEVQSIN